MCIIVDKKLLYALLKMDIGEKEIEIEQSEKFMDESLEDSQAMDGLSDNKPPSEMDGEEDIKETK